jgi:hypothetical protein
MSAAATAAGYLYASGRLRGRAQREQEGHPEQPTTEKRSAPLSRPRIERPRKEVRVAALPEPEPQPQPARPRRTPTVQYRTRRWHPPSEE